MAVISSAFGRVNLTGEDAKKFQRQVTFGRPKQAAKENVERGVEMVRAYHANGGELILNAPAKK